METFQEQLLKKVEDMMNRGPEARHPGPTAAHVTGHPDNEKKRPP
jgi:hypothetical protein